jgi:hypothetical protein
MGRPRAGVGTMGKADWGGMGDGGVALPSDPGVGGGDGGHASASAATGTRLRGWSGGYRARGGRRRGGVAEAVRRGGLAILSCLTENFRRGVPMRDRAHCFECSAGSSHPSFWTDSRVRVVWVFVQLDAAFAMQLSGADFTAQCIDRSGDVHGVDGGRRNAADGAFGWR